jgi:hypothetical protein
MKKLLRQFQDARRYSRLNLRPHLHPVHVGMAIEVEVGC